MFDITQEAEGAGGLNFIAENIRRQFNHLALAANNGGREVNLYIQMKTLCGGAQFGKAASMFDTDRLEHFDIGARSLGLHNAGAVDEFDKILGRAVQNRHFRPVDFNVEIVNA